MNDKTESFKNSKVNMCVYSLYSYINLNLIYYDVKDVGGTYGIKDQSLRAVFLVIVCFNFANDRIKRYSLYETCLITC